MRAYLQSCFSLFDFPEGSHLPLLSAYDALISDQARKTAFGEILHRYAEDRDTDFMEMVTAAQALAAQAGIHEYIANMLLFLCLTKTQREYFAKDGIDDSIWHTSMCDLKYKLVECQSVHGIWGTFVPTWYARFYKIDRFGFGNLQFETVPFPGVYCVEGVTPPARGIVINVHIPRTGKKLDKQVMAESYAAAAAFFKKRYQLEQVIFYCSSWLLYPKNLEVLSPDSNLYAFITQFTLLKQGEYEDYSQVWRLFDVEYAGDVDKLPQDSSLRRAYADWIRKGVKTGWGCGFYIFPDKN